MKYDLTQAGPLVELPQRPRLAPRSIRWPLLGFLLCVIVPTGLAAGYFWGIAVDRYVTELRYSIRGGAALGATDPLGTALGATPGLAFAGDAYVIEDYLVSAQAITDLEARLPLREMLGRDGGDPLRGYDPNAPLEDLLVFWRNAIDVRFDVVTGITIVEVSAFAPDDAQLLGKALVDMMRVLVDQLSQEARTETLAYVDSEFSKAETRLTDASNAIEKYRRTNEVVSPTDEAQLGSSVIAQLTNTLTELRVRLRSLRQNTPNSPQIATVQDRIASLQAQIATERRRIGAGGDTGGALSGQLMDFERLQNEYAIAKENYVSTLQLRQQAQANATLNQVQLVVFVPPRLPHLAQAPDRPGEVMKIFGLAFVLWLVGRILLASLRTP